MVKFPQIYARKIFMLKSKDKAKLNTKHYYIIYLRYLLFFGIVNSFSLDFRFFLLLSGLQCLIFLYLQIFSLQVMLMHCISFVDAVSFSSVSAAYIIFILFLQLLLYPSSASSSQSAGPGKDIRQIMKINILLFPANCCHSFLLTGYNFPVSAPACTN